jgi:GDP/UDP-N,N'-diacetylbacillosamine 2-epimerase (hydrolysing)
MNIGMVTGSRSEWGLLFPLVREIAKRPEGHLELFITGSHLSSEQGHTYAQVVHEVDALDANAQRLFVAMHLVETQMAGDSKLSVCETIGNTVAKFGDKLRFNDLECLIVLGDRYESFAAATAAHINRIPIVHIHGGEVTEGAYDDALRHSITKMSSLHLVATELYGRRVVQLGENPDSVFNCGALGVEALDDYRCSANKDEKSVVVCWHPVTLSEDNGLSQLRVMLNILARYSNEFVFHIISPNADSGNAKIRKELYDFSRGPIHSGFYDHLPRHRFLETLASAKFIIGNSSAGIIEAPALGVPTINVGSRQKGRMRAESILEADTPEEISACINFVDSEANKRIVARKYWCPYGRGGPVAKTMLDTILSNKHILMRRKVFYDQ